MWFYQLKKRVWLVEHASQKGDTYTDVVRQRFIMHVDKYVRH